MIIEILDRKKSIIYDATEDFISIDWSFDERNDKNIVTLKMNITNDVLKNILKSSKKKAVYIRLVMHDVTSSIYTLCKIRHPIIFIDYSEMCVISCEKGEDTIINYN